MQQAVEFLEESESLHELVRYLKDEDLNQETSFKNWTLNDVFRHLHVWNYAADLSLQADNAFLTFFEELGTQLSSGKTLREVEAAHLDGLSGCELVETWRSFYMPMSERFAESDPSRRLKWAGPDMSVRSSITARLMETWAHGQEVYDVLGEVRRNEDRIRNIVVLGNNTYGWTYHVRSEQPPEPVPHLRLTAPSGEVWTYNEPHDNETIEGLAEEFCQVVTQVRNIADTGLVVTGENAIDWMSKAQCFAGAAQAPPPPGTRKMAALVVNGVER
jgi:uncharacterized protein (TIGR03084 family)